MSAVTRLIALWAVFAATAPPATPPIIHAYYLGGEGCHGCAVGDDTIDRLVASDPQVRLVCLDINRDYALAQALLVVAGLDALPTAPSLLVGTTYVDNAAFGPTAVQRATDAYRGEGAPDLMPKALQIEPNADKALPAVLRKWGPLAVIGAGLLDGVNPCAFATLIFFISYLAVAGARGHRLLAVGLLYAGGVFVAYFAFGLGILKALLSLDAFPAIRQALYGVIAMVCLGLAGISVYDARQLRMGCPTAVLLQLPEAFKQSTHAAVRRGVRSRWILPAAFAAGAVVSVLEVACTGQVYVPAITYVITISDTPAIAMAWLALYDLMFVVPLLILLALVLAGVSSKRLAQWAEHQAASTKCLMAAFFTLAAVYFTLKLGGLI